ncbi:hypothetical protein [Streptomyces sp. NPDC093591]|uniref:hypothetical protein n=1 Tax=Streptomyces sp. NPDC093591 TaxID=3366044 RepID=UPI00382FB03F
MVQPAAASYVYGPDGSRLLRKEKGAVTLYLGAQEIRLDMAKNSLSGTRYYSHGGQTIAVRTTAGVTWLVGGQNGTAEIAMKAADSAITQRRTLPFGEVRGAKPAAGVWPGPNSMRARLNLRKGLPVPEFPLARNIQWLMEK